MSHNKKNRTLQNIIDQFKDQVDIFPFIEELLTIEDKSNYGFETESRIKQRLDKLLDKIVDEESVK
jgi:hypothetical protein